MKNVHTLADLRRWPELMRGENPPARLAVIGDPVAHSASPPMHNAALGACGINACYTRLHLRADELAEAFALLPQQGFIGVNCTIPHKAEALRLVHRADDHARQIGAVNTIRVEGDALVAFNTDGPGLVRAVQAEFGVALCDLRILVLGAGGGAGRAVAMQCALEKCPRLVLVNRTIEKAHALAAELAPLLSTVAVAPDGGAELQMRLAETDLVINCTSVGLKADDPSPIAADLLHPALLVYDSIYTAARTALMLAADQAGARSANGLSMLLRQGALAFEIWFGRAAPLDAMSAALLSTRTLGSGSQFK